MRTTVASSLLALGLLPGTLAAQLPRNPRVPNIPDVSFSLGPNTREYVASDCWQGRLPPPGAPRGVPFRNLTVQCTAARLVYSWTETGGFATMFLAHDVHPWVERQRFNPRTENPMNLDLDVTLSTGRVSRFEIDWHGFTGPTSLNEVLGASLRGDFGSQPFPIYASGIPAYTELYYQYGRDEAGFVESSTIALRFTAVPEPSTWALLGTGLLSLGGIAARKRKRAEA